MEKSWTVGCVWSNMQHGPNVLLTMVNLEHSQLSIPGQKLTNVTTMVPHSMCLDVVQPWSQVVLRRLELISVCLPKIWENSLRQSISILTMIWRRRSERNSSQMPKLWFSFTAGTRIRVILLCQTNFYQKRIQGRDFPKFVFSESNPTSVKWYLQEFCFLVT